MRFFWVMLLTSLLFFTIPAHAEEGSAPPPYAKLETFTVNLTGLSQYLQVDISLKVADPKITESIKAWNPVIRHELLLLLSSQSAQDISTLAGKQKVTGQIKTAINKVLKLSAKEGVTDVLFESFVIQ